MDDEIFEIVAKILKVPPQEVDLESDVESLPNWDSTNHMRLVLALEDRFGIEFNEDQIVAMTSVAKLRDTVSALKKN